MILIISPLYVNDAQLSSVTKFLLDEIRKKDIITILHSQNVGYYMKKFCPLLGYDEKLCYTVGLLHDVGKIKVDYNILLKRDKLTSEEFEIMKKHVIYSAEILREHNYDKKVIETVLYHHERFDGSGYLEGLKGKEIPELSRILAIIDSFDALSSFRLYREPVPYLEALAIIEKDIEKYDRHYFRLFKSFIKNWIGK